MCNWLYLGLWENSLHSEPRCQEALTEILTEIQCGGGLWEEILPTSGIDNNNTELVGMKPWLQSQGRKSSLLTFPTSSTHGTLQPSRWKSSEAIYSVYPKDFSQHPQTLITIVLLSPTLCSLSPICTKSFIWLKTYL